jgi:hypothetical protein
MALRGYILANNLKQGAVFVSRPFREEVLNVKLAELLSKQNIISVPETIISGPEGKRLPDVIIADYWGVRVVLEGKVGELPSVRDALEKKCRERIEEAIGSISIGVVYPPAIRATPWPELERALASAQLKVKIFTATSREEDWSDSDVNGLSEILRRAYENLVAEDIVDEAVVLLRNAIEVSAGALSQFPATEGRFREILVVPKSAD